MEESQTPNNSSSGDTTPPARPTPSEGQKSQIVLAAAGMLVTFLLLAHSNSGLGLLIGLGCLALIVAMITLLARAILLPLDRAARRVEAHVQFTLIDFLCLFLWVQAPMALIHGLLHDVESERRWFLDIYAWLAEAFLWWFSVQRLSRAGITRAGHRALILVFAIPMTLVAMFATPVLIVAGIAIVGSLWSDHELPFPPSTIFIGLLGTLALAALVVLAASLTRRIVAEAGSPVESRGDS